MRATPKAILSAVLTGCALFIAAHQTARAASPFAGMRLSRFVFPIYYDTAEEGGIQTNRLKTVITGREAQPQPNSLYLITQMRIEAYALDGSTNLIAAAPECFLNASQRTAASTNQLRLEGGNGQLLISGEGFFCYLTNFNLILSNNVETIIREGLLKSARRAQLLNPADASAVAATAAALGTNTAIRILADQLSLDAPSNLVTYTGHIRLTSPQLDMTCGTLTIRRSTNGSIESVVAEQDVVIVTKQGSGTARGDRAVYSLADGEEVLTLDGTPARWDDGPRAGEAGRFTFDLRHNTLQAERQASVQLPRASLNQSDWLAAPPAKTTPVPVDTNQLLRVTAEQLIVQFPTTNQLARSILARTNVVIVHQTDGSRATSDQAFYSEATGTIELSGHAVWESERGVIKAESLFLDRTNQIFRAQQNAYLKLPVTALARRAPLGSIAVPDRGAADTNSIAQFIEVFDDGYIYQSGLLNFHDDIRVNLLEADTVLSRLTCGLLTITVSNQVERVLAEQDVALEQLPVLAGDKMIGKKLFCQWLLVNLATNGRLDNIVARTNVVGEQIEIRLQDPTPILTTMKAQSVTATFFTHTNQVDTIVAEQDVFVRQNLKMAQGSRAVYTSTNDIVELTGNPTASAPEAQITIAEVIVWDRRRNQFFIRQMRAEGKAALNGAGLPFPNR